MNNITPDTTWTVTDTEDGGTIAVDVNTTPDEFVAWYGMGDEVRPQLALVLDGIQTGNREQGLEDMLGLHVSQE